MRRLPWRRYEARSLREMERVQLYRVIAAVNDEIERQLAQEITRRWATANHVRVCRVI